ncbi:hypothetical protein FGO68_gene5464 [Halteria grandinella]|uniref:Uncharacterized protein n=1 Tax=Halteria grandinella TaxID=5974 RepID=A0A8J8NAQ7_HALGN|nr:hypothetical protein FGO68_gene5464 [Halteria grandinella]
MRGGCEESECWGGCFGIWSLWGRRIRRSHKSCSLWCCSLRVWRGIKVQFIKLFRKESLSFGNIPFRELLIGNAFPIGSSPFGIFPIGNSQLGRPFPIGTSPFGIIPKGELLLLECIPREELPIRNAWAYFLSEQHLQPPMSSDATDFSLDLQF